MNFLRERVISQAAADLIEFDSDSIRQVVAAQGLAAPDIWLADPDAYEMNGRIFRDSDSPRLLAYSTANHVLYATDGCNSCARRVETEIENLPPARLKGFAEENGLRRDLVEKLVTLIGIL